MTSAYLAYTSLREKLASLEAAAFAAPDDGAVFYSGDRDGNWLKAQAFVFGRNSTCLIDNTGAGRAIFDDPCYNLLRSKYEDKEISALKTNIDRELSRRFAECATGQVHCFVRNASHDRVFVEVELPTLLANEKISHINGISRKDLIELVDESDRSAAFSAIVLGQPAMEPVVIDGSRTQFTAPTSAPISIVDEATPEQASTEADNDSEGAVSETILLAESRSGTPDAAIPLGDGGGVVQKNLVSEPPAFTRTDSRGVFLEDYTDAKISGLAMAHASADEVAHQAGESESLQDRLHQDLVMHYGPSGAMPSERFEDARPEREAFVADIPEAAPPVFTPSNAAEEVPEAIFERAEEVAAEMSEPSPVEESVVMQTEEVAVAQEPETPTDFAEIEAEQALQAEQEIAQQEQAQAEAATQQAEQEAQAALESEQANLAAQQEAAQQQEAQQLATKQQDEAVAFRLEQDRLKQQEADAQQRQAEAYAAKQAAEDEHRVGFNDPAPDEPAISTGFAEPEQNVGFSAIGGGSGGDAISNPHESMWSAQPSDSSPGFGAAEDHSQPGFPGADGFSSPGFETTDWSSSPGFGGGSFDSDTTAASIGGPADGGGGTWQDSLSSPSDGGFSSPGFETTDWSSSPGFGGGSYDSDSTAASIGGPADGGGGGFSGGYVDSSTNWDTPGSSMESPGMSSGGFSAPVEAPPLDAWTSDVQHDEPYGGGSLLESNSGGGNWDQPAAVTSDTTTTMIEAAPEPVPEPVPAPVPAPTPTPVMIQS